MRLDGTTQPRRATSLKIGYLSAVEVPAHEGAQAVVLKARMIQKEAAHVEPMIKSAFSAALAEQQLDKQVCEALENTWQLNSALREAAEEIAKDETITDKPAALRAAFAEYIATLSQAMLGSDVAKVCGKQPTDKADAPTKTEGGVAYPASDFAYVPDPSKPSEWKLRLTSTPGGNPDPAIVGAAAAALGPGYRGQKVELPDADRAAVVARVRAAWRKANPDKKPEEMPEGIKKEAEMADENTQAELAKYKALAELSDVQKAHYNTLPEAEQSVYLAMSADDRDAVAKAAGSNDEQFTTVEGATVVKSKVGAELYAVMKSQNEQIAKLRNEADMTRLQKQAEADLAHLPGTPLLKAQVLKSVEAMPQAARDALLAMLKAGDAACKPGFTNAAAQGGEEMSAADRLEKMADSYAAEHKVTKTAAYQAVLNTDEGRKLYKEAN